MVTYVIKDLENFEIMHEFEVFRLGSYKMLTVVHSGLFSLFCISFSKMSFDTGSKWSTWTRLSCAVIKNTDFDDSSGLKPS